MRSIYLICFFSLLSSQHTHAENQDWTVLQDEDIWIGVLKTDYPKCKTQGVVDASFEEITSVIDDLSNYKIIFDSISISTINDSNEVRLAMELPLFFSNRDYTVKFRTIENDTSISYIYNSIISKDYPVEEDYIRLIDAQGGWFLEKIDSSHTLVKYIWNGDMRGDFPKWAYSKAWIKQGIEVISNLRREVIKRKDVE